MGELLPYRQDDEAIHPFAAQHLRVLDFQGQIFVGIADDKRVPELMRDCLNALGNESKKWVCYVRDDKANGMRSLETQAACELIRTVIQLLGSLEDGFLSLLADAGVHRLFIQYSGNRRDRNAGLSGYVVERNGHVRLILES